MLLSTMQEGVVQLYTVDTVAFGVSRVVVSPHEGIYLFIHSGLSSLAYFHKLLWRFIQDEMHSKKGNDKDLHSV